MQFKATTVNWQSSIIFIFALSAQINAQIAEGKEPVSESAQEILPQPEPVQSEPQIQLAQIQETAQKVEAKNFERHEIKLDIIFPAFYAIKIGYEYYLNNRSSLAITMLYFFGEKPQFQYYEDQDYEEVQKQARLQTLAQIGYRLYVFEYTAQLQGILWYFIESNLGYAGDYESRYNAFSVGFSGGMKTYPINNIGFETVIGLNRLYDGKSDRKWFPQLSMALTKKFG
jgi:hypothetical protein